MAVTEIATRRRAVVQISAQVLIMMLTGQTAPRYYTVSKNPLPDDVKVVGARYDALYDRWEIAIESEQLPEVPESETLPIWPQVSFTAHYMQLGVREEVHASA